MSSKRGRKPKAATRPASSAASSTSSSAASMDTSSSSLPSAPVASSSSSSSFSSSSSSSSAAAAAPPIASARLSLGTDLSEMTEEQLLAEADAIRARMQALEAIAATAERAPASAGAADEDIEVEQIEIPPHCIPLMGDVTKMKAIWPQLGAAVQFDAIVMDPPWQLATANPTRGVALGYAQLSDKDIADIPIPQLQTRGFLMIWVINSRYAFALELFKKWGYRMIDDVAWMKQTVNRRLAKGHGFYLQHAKETCLVGWKGDSVLHQARWNLNSSTDVICSERRGQSQKPNEIYEIVERLVPDGNYLEIFARRNNLRNHWVSVGNEL